MSRAALLLALLLAACGDGALIADQYPCRQHDNAADCTADPRCKVAGCPRCEGGTDFSFCAPRDETPDVLCPGIACAPPCSTYTDGPSCDATPGCHGVYSDKLTCACNAIGCCISFDRCAQGPPDCDGTDDVLCDAVAPPCEGEFTLAYTNACYEGCVKKTACPAL